MKLCIIVGTRPEIIKLSPLIRLCIERKLDYFILHTGQHYSHNMDEIFFEQLKIPSPNYNLKVGSATFSVQIGKMIDGCTDIFIKEKPDFVIVEGDTNSVLAATLAATNLNISLVHVEAGLRSYNKVMQEEKNRLVADALSDYLFAPTKHSFNTLTSEGKTSGLHLTGNSIVDAVNYYLPRALQNSPISKFNVKSKSYLLTTIHRAESTSSKDKMQSIIKGIEEVSKNTNLPVLFPVHPRTLSTLSEYGLSLPSCIKAISPLGFYDFLSLEKNAKLILTDSGGVQEEACIMNVPCVTLRADTERPETIEVGANMLTDLSILSILNAAKSMLSKNADWNHPFGDGTCAVQILDILSSSEVKK